MRGKLLASIIVVIALGLIAVLVFSTGRGGDSAADKGSKTTGKAVITFAQEVPRVVTEAETAKLEAPFVMIDDPAASGGKAIEIPENPDATELNPKSKTADGKPAEWEKVSKGEFAGQPLYPNGIARIPFTIKEDGEYVLWMRAYWLHGCANSLYFMIDPQKDPVDKDGNGTYDDEIIPTAFDGGGTYKIWHWVQYGAHGQNKKPETFKLSAGQHTIVIYNREDGIRLDQILFAGYSEGNEYYPTGIEKNSGE